MMQQQLDLQAAEEAKVTRAAEIKRKVAAAKAKAAAAKAEAQRKIDEA